MQREMVYRLIRNQPDIFHNVDLTASGPTHRADVGPQHPISRPDALAVRHPGASDHETILKSLLAR